MLTGKEKRSAKKVLKIKRICDLFWGKLANSKNKLLYSCSGNEMKNQIIMKRWP
jgi:hypothetical protein